jgi:hypothetical protein
MVAMRNGLMPALRTVDMLGIMPLRTLGALVRVGLADFNDMLVHMIPMHMMKMAVMQVICMSLMLNRRMSAVGAMYVRVVFMLDTITH